MLLNLLAIVWADVTASLDILWKGLLAICVVVGIVILITYVMQVISEKAAENAKKNEKMTIEWTKRVSAPIGFAIFFGALAIVAIIALIVLL